MESNKFPQRKSPRLKEFDYSSPYIYFLTTCVKDRQKIFVQEINGQGQAMSLSSEIIACIIEEKERLGFKVFCYCLMPDHLHLLLTPGGREYGQPQGLSLRGIQNQMNGTDNHNNGQANGQPRERTATRAVPTGANAMDGRDRACPCPNEARSFPNDVSRFMGGFKSKSTRICWKYGIKGTVWQGRYYDHILRKEEEIESVSTDLVNLSQNPLIFWTMEIHLPQLSNVYL